MDKRICKYIGSCDYGRYFTGCGNGNKHNCPMYRELTKDPEEKMQERIENFWLVFRDEYANVYQVLNDED